MGLFKNRAAQRTAVPVAQTAKRTSPLSLIDGYVPLSTPQTRIYYALRESLPVIDAAIFKIVRLTGGFRVICSDSRAQESLDSFIESVNVGGNQTGLDAFVSTYFEQLLTCGTAVGEILLDGNGIPYALFNAPLDDIELRRKNGGIEAEIYVRQAGESVKIKHPELCTLSVLNPDPGKLTGNSLLKGLPFVSSVLLKIFESVGQCWERVGNVRFAVTYKPQNDAVDRAYAKDRAMQVAKEWSDAMQSGSQIKDFVAVGDVQIKAIGADNQILDSEVPVKQMLEQIVAKTGLPPFMLGFSWSSTERMSAQQADVLTSELWAYRRILNPVIKKICSLFLCRSGFATGIQIVWDEITLQDEKELAQAELYRAQTESMRKENDTVEQQ